MSQFSFWAQRLENKHLFKSESRNPWRILTKKSKNKNHVTAIVESGKFLSNLGFFINYTDVYMGWI